MPNPISLDTKRWTRVVPSGRSQTVKCLNFACYYSNAAEPPEKVSEGTELAASSTVTIETPSGKWFRAKEPSSSEAPYQPSILEVQAPNPESTGTPELGPESVTTSRIAKEGVTASRLSVSGASAAGVWGTGERSPRSSAQWPGAGVPAEQAVALAEVGNFVAVPVIPGDVIKTVTVAAGKAATEKVKEWIVGLYVGETKGALLAQSKSITPTENHPKEEFYATELESAVTITTTNAPHGYVYAFFAAGAFTTNMNAIGLTYTTANQAILGVYGTAGVAGNAIYNKGGTGIKGKAEAEVPTLTAVAGVPIVALY